MHGRGQKCSDCLWGKEMGGGRGGIEGINRVGKICFNFFCKNKQEHCKLMAQYTTVGKSSVTYITESYYLNL